MFFWWVVNEDGWLVPLRCDASSSSLSYLVARHLHGLNGAEAREELVDGVVLS